MGEKGGAMEGKREMPKLRGAVDLLKAGVNPIPQPTPERRNDPSGSSMVWFIAGAAILILMVVAGKLLWRAGMCQ
jgi:hypothetical protein